MAEGIDISQNGKVNLDMKTLVGIIAMIMAIATVYFSLQSKIAQLELDVVRMQDSLVVNTEFRIKWPRGELGALPDDAVQDINIDYIKDAIVELKEMIEELEEEVEDHVRLSGH